LCLIAAMVLLGCSLFSPVGYNTGNPPAGGVGVPSGNTTGNVQIGRVWTASNVDQNSCPTDRRDAFSGSQTIFMAAELVYVPRGTSLMARWAREGRPFEDTPVITTDRDYQNQCLEFHVDPSQTLQSGNYSVTLLVNGQPAQSANFQVR
jgi:hypothetical protein